MKKQKRKGNTGGFQDDIKVVGESSTDQDMKERLTKHQKEIEEFYVKHPHLKHRRIFDYEAD